MEHNYDFRFDLTRGLKIDFSAVNSSRIDEPLGALDKNLPGYQARRDTILQSILDKDLDKVPINADCTPIIPLHPNIRGAANYQ